MPNAFDPNHTVDPRMLPTDDDDILALKGGDRGGSGGTGGPVGPGPGGGGEALGFFGGPAVGAERNPYVRRRLMKPRGMQSNRALQAPMSGGGWSPQGGVPKGPAQAAGGAWNSFAAPGGIAQQAGGAQGLPAGWQDRGDKRESDIDLAGVIGPNGQFSLPQLLQHLTGKSIVGGVFDPMGSQGLIDLLSRNGANQIDSSERSARLGAELSAGSDPYLRAFAGSQARQQGQNQLAEMLTRIQGESALQNQSFLQQLFGGPVTGAATRKDQPQGSPWAQAGGQVAGMGLGALLGGWGK